MTDLTTKIAVAAEHVSLLDRIGAFVDGDYHDIDGEEWTGDHLLRLVAGDIAAVVGSHYGTGSWAASHGIRKLTVADVTILLMAYGASRFTVEQHASRLHGIVKSQADRGGE